jgi:pyridoxine kinase
MARIIVLSSQVVRGHVGLSAIVPVLQRAGHEVWAMPTILLSNHPGHARAAGMHVPVNTLLSMIDALDANGWLAGVDAVLTGYLPSVAHVDAALTIIGRLRSLRSGVFVVCDPVLGDDPKGVYIDKDAAIAIRDRLLPTSDLLKPNRFELSWLSEMPVDTVAQAVTAARSLRCRAVLATSVPDGTSRLCNVLVDAMSAYAAGVTRRPKVPHGTGDLLSALFLGHSLSNPDMPAQASLGCAVADVEATILVSEGRDELNLERAQRLWAATSPVPVIEIQVL